MNPCSNSSLFRRALPAAGLALLAAFQANAVIFSFTGEIEDLTDPHGLLPAEITAGATFTGTFSYDPAQASSDSAPGNPNIGNYVFTNPGGGDFSLTFNLGGHVWASAPTPAGPFNTVTVFNDHSTMNDALDYYAVNLTYDGGSLPAGVAANSQLSLAFRDPTATALNSDAVPDSVPLLSLFSTASVTFYGEDGMGNSASFSGPILTVTPVPEPGEWAVIAGGLLGAFALARRRRA